MRERKTDRQTYKTILARACVGLMALLIGRWLIVTLWRGMLALPLGLVAAWALIATALIPLASWAAWYFGHTEVRGWLSGMDKAIDKVMGTATDVATLRGQVRQQEPPQMPAVRLPEIIEIRPRLAQGREVIDL